MEFDMRQYFINLPNVAIKLTTNIFFKEVITCYGKNPFKIHIENIQLLSFEPYTNQRYTIAT